MTRVALLVLAALAVSSSQPRRLLLGPPLLCHELQIGSAQSLPWKGGPFGMDPTFASERVIPETIRILGSSDDALVHMETLRRACVYLTISASATSSSPLGASLKDALVTASLPISTTKGPIQRRETLAWFDFGYLLAIQSNGGGSPSMPGVSSCRPLERAALGAPRDPALQFGVALGQLFWFGQEEPDAASWRARGKEHLAVSIELTTAKNTLMATNLAAFSELAGPSRSDSDFKVDEVHNKLGTESRPR